MVDPDEVTQSKFPTEIPNGIPNDAITDIPEQEQGEDVLDVQEEIREKEKFKTLAQRAQADLVNYRRRATEEKEEVRRDANSRLLLNILSIVDSMEKAIDLVPKDAVSTGWYEGLELVLRNIMKILESEGVERIEAIGRDFEPKEFEAILHEESSDIEDGQVLGVLREGYKHHDRVLRAVQVIVAKMPVPNIDDDNKFTEEESQ